MKNKPYPPNTASYRISLICRELGLNKQEFAASVNRKRQTIYNTSGEISDDLANAIIVAYPQFSHKWLMTGEGEMLVQGHGSVVNYGTNSGVQIGSNGGCVENSSDTHTTTNNSTTNNTTNNNASISSESVDKLYDIISRQQDTIAAQGEQFAVFQRQIDRLLSMMEGKANASARVEAAPGEKTE